MRWIVALVGLWMSLDANVRKFEGFFAEYDERRLDLIAKFLPDNPVIVEAGGAHATDTIDFSKKWPKAEIYSFEPNPHAFFEEFIKRTAGIPNIHGYNLALNTYNGTTVLNVCWGSSGDNPAYEGASSLLEASDWMKVHYQGPKIEVPCVILQDWCRDHGIDHVDCIWLDTEGLELPIFKSSPELLKTVKVIHTETNFKAFRKGTTQYAELREFLENAGFTLLAHWYIEGVQGDALFVRDELFSLVFTK